MSVMVAEPVPSTDGETRVLSSLLRYEASAVDAYSRILGRFTDPAYQLAVNVLARIRDEHIEAVGVLAEREVGSDEPELLDAGGDGFAPSLGGPQKLTGLQATLAALKRAEQHGLLAYEKAVRCDAVSLQFAQMIRSDLLPRTQDHVKALGRLVGYLEARSREG